PTGKALLEALFGNSPFLTQCCLLETGFLRQTLLHGPDATFAALLAALNQQCRDLEGENTLEREAVMRQLRIARRQSALLIAVSDIAGLWSLERVTAALSAFAEAALGVAIRHLLHSAARAGEITPAHDTDSERDSGLLVLGMGKLGANELNYSSDI